MRLPSLWFQPPPSAGLRHTQSLLSPRACLGPVEDVAFEDLAAHSSTDPESFSEYPHHRVFLPQKLDKMQNNPLS